MRFAVDGSRALLCAWLIVTAACGGSSSRPASEAPPVAGCTVTLSGPVRGEGACTSDPGAAGSMALVSYAFPGHDRFTSFDVQAAGNGFTYQGKAVAPVVAVQFHLAGAPAAKSYRFPGPDVESNEGVTVDLRDASGQFLEWGSGAGGIQFTLTLTGVTRTSEAPANDGEEDYLAHGTFDAALEADPGTTASGTIDLQLAF
jgi:hypothetical protein